MRLVSSSSAHYSFFLHGADDLGKNYRLYSPTLTEDPVGNELRAEHTLVGEMFTERPLQSSKQAKVTSGEMGLNILWLMVGCIRRWRWEQRVVDADSLLTDGIKSSYFMCVCVPALCILMCPACMCIYVAAMWLALNTYWCILRKIMKALQPGTCTPLD